MEMKKLIINCGVCDATCVTQERLAGYDTVKINCGCILATPESQRVMTDHGVNLNTGNVVMAPDGVAMTTRMGSFTVTADGAPRVPTALLVMGNLTIEPGAGEAAAAYAHILVMGNLTCPKSVSLGNVSVMGNQTFYPDGYDYVGDDVRLDRLTHHRWAGRKLFVNGDVIVERDADLAALLSSGTVFACKKLVTPEALLDDALKLTELSNDAEIAVLPDGAAYISGGQKLTRSLVRRSKKLYIDGKLTVERRKAQLLEELEYLHVTGRALVPEEWEERFLALDSECEDVAAYRGTLITGRESVSVTKPLIAREGFVTIRDCEVVTLDPSLTDAEITTQLSFCACDRVICTLEQKPAVEAVCEGVEEIGPEESPQPEKPADPDPNTVKINSGTYKF